MPTTKKLPLALRLAPGLNRNTSSGSHAQTQDSRRGSYSGDQGCWPAPNLKSALRERKMDFLRFSHFFCDVYRPGVLQMMFYDVSRIFQKLCVIFGAFIMNFHAFSMKNYKNQWNLLHKITYEKSRIPKNTTFFRLGRLLIEKSQTLKQDISEMKQSWAFRKNLDKYPSQRSRSCHGSFPRHPNAEKSNYNSTL